MENSPKGSYLSPEQRGEQAERTVSDAELIKEGAKYDKRGILTLTEKQIEFAKMQMEKVRGVETREDERIKENITKLLERDGIVLNKVITTEIDDQEYPERFRLGQILRGQNSSFFILDRSVEAYGRRFGRVGRVSYNPYLCMYDNGDGIKEVFGFDQLGSGDGGAQITRRDGLDKMFSEDKSSKNPNSEKLMKLILTEGKLAASRYPVMRLDEIIEEGSEQTKLKVSFIPDHGTRTEDVRSIIVTTENAKDGEKLSIPISPDQLNYYV